MTPFPKNRRFNEKEKEKETHHLNMTHEVFVNKLKFFV